MNSALCLGLNMDNIDPMLCQECPAKQACIDLWKQVNADYQQVAQKTDRYVPGVWGGQRWGKDLLCSAVACDRRASAKGMCDMHYKRTTLCKVDGCDNGRKFRGWCHGHAPKSYRDKENARQRKVRAAS